MDKWIDQHDPAHNTTLALACIIVLVLVFKWKLRPPPPQLHPFLLGRQSIPSLTRLQDESPIYTNPNKVTTSFLRPEKKIRNLKNVLEGSLTCLEGGQRGSWVKGGEKVTDLVNHLRAGLVTKLGKGSTGKVIVSIQDPTGSFLSLSPNDPLLSFRRCRRSIGHSCTRYLVLQTNRDRSWISTSRRLRYFCDHSVFLQFDLECRFKLECHDHRTRWRGWKRRR